MSNVITEELRQALSQNHPVEIVDPDTGDVYVVVRRDQYERMRRLTEVEEIDPSFYEAEDVELFDRA